MQILHFTLPLLALAPLSVPGAPPADGLRPWTVLVYGGADNNADGPILEFLDTVRKAIDDDPGIELLLLLDRAEGFSDDATLLGEDFTGARLFRLGRDSAERLSGGEHFPELTLEEDAELDSSDAETLARFIAWGKEAAPAERYGLMIYSHADGRTLCPDEASGGDMAIPELSRVLGEEHSVDFLALELCNMAGIEIAYEWRPGPGRFGADVLVAIPNAGPPLDWDRAFARIRSAGHESRAAEPWLDPREMTARDFGALVIQEGRRGREAAAHGAWRASREAAGCYDLTRAERVKHAVDELAVSLAQHGPRDVFFEMRGPGPIGDAILYDGADGPYVDLFDLARRTVECDAFADETRARAEAVMEAVDEFVVASFGMAAYAGFDAGRHGLFIVLPIDEPGRWSRFGWYTPGSFERSPGGKDFGGWSFLADGATPGDDEVSNWFELLDAWMDDPTADEGGWNGYRW